jgi:hypothetical protein
MAGMKYRKLRIAWSVGCGILCLLLIALWVRSLGWRDMVRWQPNGEVILRCASLQGTMQLSAWFGDSASERALQVQATSIENLRRPLLKRTSGSPISAPHRWLLISNKAVSVFVPCWLLVLVSGYAGTIPWYRWRFSLRTLLIATTLVAVMLGLIVWTARI